MLRSMYAALIVAATGVPAYAQDPSTQADSILRAAEAKGFSGVVRIESDGKLVLEKGYGFANRAEKIAFSPQTVVQIGSNTKDFTAVAILQLKDKGLLKLSDPLSKFFPSTPPDKRGITISQLLDHTAGFPLGLGPDKEQATKQQLIDRAMAFRLLFSPGERESYSNTGFALLAAIIENLSGKSYDQYVRDDILAPLGLKDTGFHLPGFETRRLAHGYDVTGADRGTMLSTSRAPDGPFWNLRGNGGMLSTVADMHAFYQALFETDKLLLPATRNQRFALNGPIVLAGSDLVSAFVYEKDPMQKLEIIIATNSADWKPARIRRELDAVPGLRGYGGKREISGAAAPLAQREGKPPIPAIATIVTGLIETINSGDRDRLRRFITENFETGGGAPTVDERLERLAPMHANLGRLEIQGMVAPDDEPVQVRLKTANEGGATLTVDIARTAPYRIRRLGLLVGGE